MSKSNQRQNDGSFVDPWCHDHRGKLPRTARRIGGWDSDVGIDAIPEELFLTRTGTQDRLWVRSHLYEGCVAGAARTATESEAASELVDMLIRARFPYAGPVPPYLAGLLASDELRDIVDAIVAEVQHNRHKAEAAQSRDEAPIITLARQLGLNPRPAGHSDRAWIANCLRGSHSIMISPSDNEFGCGYCRRHGGLAELQAFYDEQRVLDRHAQADRC